METLFVSALLAAGSANDVTLLVAPWIWLDVQG